MALKDSIEAKLWDRDGNVQGELGADDLMAWLYGVGSQWASSRIIEWLYGDKTDLCLEFFREGGRAEIWIDTRPFDEQATSRAQCRELLIRSIMAVADGYYRD